MCLSFFTSVDKNCYLDVIVNVNKINVFNQTVKGFNEDNLLKSWKEIEIKTNLIGKGEIIFFRRRLDNNTTGYWAIDDIRFCNKNIGNTPNLCICVFDGSTIIFRNYFHRLFS
jgi:hypothetical protein